ncbi:MAG: DUF2007 domain-containing protein [Gammaproteobacteria bacterium]
MKSIYEASTALDAYMVLNLLEQEGIKGRVDGEYLPGGVGEIQAINIVRVMVNESDYEKAGQVIRDWEAIEVEKEDDRIKKPAAGVSTFILGLLIGGGLILWVYNTPVTEDGIDMNGDGVLDEKWIYRDNRIIITEVDRNFDRNADIVYYFDRRGILKTAKYDDNFDGIYETEYKYKNGLTHFQSSDVNQDGNVDYRATYIYGNIDEIEILGEGGDLRKKRQKFRMGKLISAELDSDGDGSYDVEYTYDYFEEVESKSNKRLQIDAAKPRD